MILSTNQREGLEDKTLKSFVVFYMSAFVAGGGLFKVIQTVTKCIRQLAFFNYPF